MPISTLQRTTFNQPNAMVDQIIIDLNDHRFKKARIFTTRPRGEEVRKKSKIDVLEPTAEQIIVSIPADTITVNPSFLEEFLRFVVLKLGAEGFRRKFKFEKKGSFDIEENLQLAIEHILRNTNALVR
jgi:hypothetical protein